MPNPKKKHILSLSEKVIKLIVDGDHRATLLALKPILTTKCPFHKLDLLGKEIGQAGIHQSRQFFRAFDEIVDYGAMGGYVIVGQALCCFLKDNFEMVMRKSREYIIKGDVWYVCDIIGERSLGTAVVSYFNESIPWFKRFLEDENKWVKRSVGVAIHFFSKRVLNNPLRSKKLLDVIEPYLEEKRVDVVKGIGWGLKTIGRHHPDILIGFLKQQVRARKRISKLMMRKALTYVNEERKAAINHDL